MLHVKLKCLRRYKVIERESVELWAKLEFGGAELGDKRRSERLVEIAASKAKIPEGAMTTNCKKSESQLITRLFSRKEVTMESVTKAHKKRTLERCKEREVVLAVQDTTSLDFSSHKDLKGLGHLSRHNAEQGLWLHTMLAVTPDRTPLGVLHQKVWARDPETFGIKKERHNRPFEEKESYRWVESVESTKNLLKDVKKVIVVGDRESDIFELFANPRRENTELLIRATHDRRVEISDEENGEVKQAKLFDVVLDAPVLGTYNLKVPARPGRKKRDAQIAVRAKALWIIPPVNCDGCGPIKMYCISAIESMPPEDGKEGIDWKLLTTMTADNFNDCKYFIKCYSARWVIEEYHKVLKSGCKIEKLQFETLDRLLPAMGICCVVAWRVLFLSKYARENPDDDASVVSTEVERNVLSAWLRSRKEKNWQVKTVKDFVIGVAKLGGFLGRKSDGNPGTKTLWQGLRNLEYLVSGYQLAAQMHSPSGVK